MKNIVKVAVLVVMVSIVGGSSFGVGSFNWFTDALVDEAILYPADGSPGVGDTSLTGISGAADWYAMVYDTALLDVATYDPSDYATPELARTAVLSSELYGGDYLNVFTSPDESYIDEFNIDGSTYVDDKLVGTIVFNVSNPATAAIGGLMFAYSTKTYDMPAFTGSTPIQNYDAGVIGFNGAEWKAVPEPVTAMIAFLGVPVAVLVRRRMNK